MSVPADAFDDVVAREGARLCGLAIAIAGSVAAGEDAYQTSLIAAWRSWHQLRDPSRRAQWLSRITARKAMGARRRLAEWLPLGVGQHEPALEQEMPWAPDVGRALDGLSARQRAVVVLHYVHGHTLDETARLLGISAGTARSHLARALGVLRKRLEP